MQVHTPATGGKSAWVIQAFFYIFVEVAAAVAYAHLAMLGSQPKTDFFVTTNATGHNTAENNNGDDNIETLEEKKGKKSTCNMQQKPRFVAVVWAMSLTEKFLAWKLQKNPGN